MEIHADDSLTLTFAALADPTRRAILTRLAHGDADVSELMKPFALSQPTISKHLKVLERAGLIEQSRAAQRRPRTIVTASLQEIDEWLVDFRKLWESRFASLDDYLAKVQTRTHATTHSNPRSSTQPSTTAATPRRQTKRGKKK